VRGHFFEVLSRAKTAFPNGRVFRSLSTLSIPGSERPNLDGTGNQCYFGRFHRRQPVLKSSAPDEPTGLGFRETRRSTRRAQSEIELAVCGDDCIATYGDDRLDHKFYIAPINLGDFDFSQILLGRKSITRSFYGYVFAARPQPGMKRIMTLPATVPTSPNADRGEPSMKLFGRSTGS
jgi:hypothetical protein